MTDLHLDYFLYVLHSCTHYYQSRGLVTWSSFSAGVIEVLLRDCMAHTTKLHGVFFPPNFGCFAHFLTTRLYGVNQPYDSIFSSRNMILFNNIIMHLLYSCIRCDLDHSCSIHHNSRDGLPIFWTTRL